MGGMMPREGGGVVFSSAVAQQVGEIIRGPFSCAVMLLKNQSR
ncbi:hypothetical protein HanHA89_Chr02g0079531 [Helianthus annuus]|nr:hypothetical protein HanHA89_Chr02g0079531 [Helianthus annuus]